MTRSVAPGKLPFSTAGRQFADSLLRRLPRSAADRPTGASGSSTQLAGLFDECRTAWPNILVAPQRFARHLAERLPADVAALESLQGRRILDLYLACACLDGCRQALEALERTVLDDVSLALHRRRYSPSLVEEVVQHIRARLMVADGNQTPLLVDYSGRGTLRSWLRAVAVHAAIKLLRHDRRRETLDDNLVLERATRGSDPELSYLKRAYAAAFKQAFGQALAALSRRERNLLRHHYLDGLSLDQMARVYGVHRATVARWLAQVRERLLGGTQQALGERLAASGHEVASIMRLARSRLDVSLRVLLAPTDPDS